MASWLCGSKRKRPRTRSWSARPRERGWRARCGDRRRHMGRVVPLRVAPRDRLATTRGQDSNLLEPITVIPSARHARVRRSGQLSTAERRARHRVARRLSCCVVVPSTKGRSARLDARAASKVSSVGMLPGALPIELPSARGARTGLEPAAPRSGDDRDSAARLRMGRERGSPVAGGIIRSDNRRSEAARGELEARARCGTRWDTSPSGFGRNRTSPRRMDFDNGSPSARAMICERASERPCRLRDAGESHPYASMLDLSPPCTTGRNTTAAPAGVKGKKPSRRRGRLSGP